MWRALSDLTPNNVLTVAHRVRRYPQWVYMTLNARRATGTTSGRSKPWFETICFPCRFPAWNGSSCQELWSNIDDRCCLLFLQSVLCIWGPLCGQIIMHSHFQTSDSGISRGSQCVSLFTIEIVSVLWSGFGLWGSPNLEITICRIFYTLLQTVLEQEIKRF